MENLRANGVTSFLPAFKSFVEDRGVSMETGNLDEQVFRTQLTNFLFNPLYRGHMRSIKFNGTLVPGQPAPTIRMMTFGYEHSGVTSTKAMIKALKEVTAIVKESSADFESGRAFVHSQGIPSPYLKPRMTAENPVICDWTMMNVRDREQSTLHVFDHFLAPSPPLFTLNPHY